MYILTHPRLLPSARALAIGLRPLYHGVVLSTCNPEKVMSGRHLIRWGNSAPCRIQSNLNMAQAIPTV